MLKVYVNFNGTTPYFSRNEKNNSQVLYVDKNLCGKNIKIVHTLDTDLTVNSLNRDTMFNEFSSCNNFKNDYFMHEIAEKLYNKTKLSIELILKLENYNDYFRNEGKTDLLPRGIYNPEDRKYYISENDISSRYYNSEDDIDDYTNIELYMDDHIELINTIIKKCFADLNLSNKLYLGDELRSLKDVYNSFIDNGSIGVHKSNNITKFSNEQSTDVSICSELKFIYSDNDFIIDSTDKFDQIYYLFKLLRIAFDENSDLNVCNFSIDEMKKVIKYNIEYDRIGYGNLFHEIEIFLHNRIRNIMTDYFFDNSDYLKVIRPNNMFGLQPFINNGYRINDFYETDILPSINSLPEFSELYNVTKTQKTGEIQKGFFDKNNFYSLNPRKDIFFLKNSNKPTMGMPMPMSSPPKFMGMGQPPMGMGMSKPSMGMGLPPMSMGPPHMGNTPNSPTNSFNTPNSPTNSFNTPNSPTNNFNAPNSPTNNFNTPNSPTNNFNTPNSPTNNFNISPTNIFSQPTNNIPAPNFNQPMGFIVKDNKTILVPLHDSQKMDKQLNIKYDNLQLRYMGGKPSYYISDSLKNNNTNLFEYEIEIEYDYEDLNTAQQSVIDVSKHINMMIEDIVEFNRHVKNEHLLDVYLRIFNELFSEIKERVFYLLDNEIFIINKSVGRGRINIMDQLKKLIKIQTDDEAINLLRYADDLLLIFYE